MYGAHALPWLAARSKHYRLIPPDGCILVYAAAHSGPVHVPSNIKISGAALPLRHIQCYKLDTELEDTLSLLIVGIAFSFTNPQLLKLGIHEQAQLSTWHTTQ
jgi:hypothetical protein